MIEEGDRDMLKACFPPTCSDIAYSVFYAIYSYSKCASIIISGMSVPFQGLDKDYLVRNAKRFKNIDLLRYEPYIDLYERELAKLYNKRNKSGK